MLGMKTLLALLLLACAPIARAAVPPLHPAQLDPPSVLVITLDDIGSTEWATLTSLQSLASVGTRFTNYYTWPLCSPTRAAMLSGRYPRRDGIGGLIQSGGAPPPDRVNLTLAESLLPTHRTCFTGKWHLGRLSLSAGAELIATDNSGPLGSGFESWLAGTYANVGAYYSWTRIQNQTTSTETAYATDVQAEEFLDWWSTTDGPKFAWLAFNAAHEPFDTPPGMSAGTSARSKYLKVVEYLDGTLADVLATVDSETFVIVSGDNGTPNVARPSGTPSGYWKGSTYGHDEVFGGGVCSPLVIAGPGVGKNVTSDRLVSAVDLSATIMELVGIAPGRGFDDSQSFADELGSWTGEAERTWVLTELYTSTSDDLAIIEDGWKMRVFDADGAGSGAPVARYFNLASDQWEAAPLTASQVDAIDSTVVPRMASHLASLPARL